MTRFTDHEFRKMASDPSWDKREPTMPTMSFNAWCIAEERRRVADIVAELVEEGWSDEDAWAAATQIEEDGGRAGHMSASTKTLSCLRSTER